MLITDTFPAPVLDPSKWTSVEIGTVSLDVGVPVDGVYPHGVDDDGDFVSVDSKNKIVVPGGTGFDAYLFYGGIYPDADQVITTFFGWRSLQQDILGNPLNGVDVLLAVSPGPSYLFKKRVINWGVSNESDIMSDPLSGADGGFRMVRAGANYEIFRWDGAVWVSLTTVNLPQNGPGFMIFGVYAQNQSFIFPWIAQT